MADEEGNKAEGEAAKRAAPAAGTIQVNSRQRGNPILKSIRSVPWEFADGLAPDYILGTLYPKESMSPYT